MAGRSATLLVWLALGLTAAIPGATADPPQDTIAAVNAARAVRGVAPVVERAELTVAAAAHAEDMARRGYLGLDPPGRGVFRDRFVQANHVPAASRTLLAAGYPDPGLLVESLLGEEGAASALLDPAVGEIGVGYAPGPYRVADGGIVTHAWLLVLAETRFTPIAGATDGLVAAINHARGRRGLPPVTPAQELAATAADHARDMVERGYFGHDAPDGSQVFERAHRRGYGYRGLGENLAVGQGSPEEVVAGWTDSPGHAAVLYHADFREVGAAYLPGPLDAAPRSFRHVWVAVFGVRQRPFSRPGGSPPSRRRRRPRPVQ